MKQWLVEFRKSWRDKNFICGITLFILAYLLLAAIGLLVSQKIYITLISGIAGWQIASWSYRLAPKLKAKLFKD